MPPSTHAYRRIVRRAGEGPSQTVFDMRDDYQRLAGESGRRIFTPEPA